jgi:hypothetical protein
MLAVRKVPAFDMAIGAALKRTTAAVGSRLSILRLAERRARGA